MRVQIRELKKKNRELTNEVAALKHAASHAMGNAVEQGQKEVLERLLKVMQPTQNE